MTIQYINTGSSANAGNGDSLRSAFVKVNNNFAYLSTASFGSGTGNGYTGSQGDIGYTGSQGNRGYTGSAPNLPPISVTAPAPGSIAYYSSQNAIIGAARLLIDDLDGSLTISGSGVGAPALNVIQDLYTPGPIVRTSQFHENIDASNFSFLRARGTLASPQTVQVGDEIGEISWDTYDSTGTYVVGALITTLVDQAPAPGRVPMSFRFTTHNGTDFGTRMFISSTGTVRFNRLAALGNATTIDIASNLIPTADLAYDLGSSTRQWRSLYVSSSTVYINRTPLTIDDQGALLVNGSSILGTPGYTGSQGSLGYAGSRGDAGFVGSQGNLGYTGSQGANGLQGNRGYTGSEGAQGSPGQQGQTGAQGVSVTLVGSTSTSAELPLTGSAGDGWIVNNTGNLWFWSTVNSQWEDIGQIVGPQGNAGYTGSTGLQGDIGLTGDAGYTGSQGANGYVGSQGDTGYAGSQGELGYVGSQGEVGYTGSTGGRGFQGYSGSQGVTGYVGSLGYTGSQGDIGLSGIDTTSTLYSGTLTVTLNATGDLVPSTDILQDLGSPTNRFRHVYVGPGSVYIGNNVITEAATGGLVLPGVTRATGYYADKVDNEDDWGSNPTVTGTVTVIDATRFDILSGRPASSNYSPATYTAEKDGNRIDEINVSSGGSGWDKVEADYARDNNMYATNVVGAIDNFNAGDWTQIPFRVEVKAEDVEYEDIFGGGTTLPSQSGQDGKFLTTDGSDLSWATVSGSDGGSSFNIGTVNLHNGGNQTAQILQFTDDRYQAVITGPATAEGQSAQRLIIQGQNGGENEGGDVYLWGGDAQHDGGDIKIYAGDADSDTSGEGGYINIQAGRGYTDGGDVNITGGYSTTGPGGRIRLEAGNSGNSELNGEIQLVSYNKQWTFNRDGNLELPTGGEIRFSYGYIDQDTGTNDNALRISGGNGVVIKTDEDGKTWEFDYHGALRLPEGGDILDSNGDSVLGGGSGATTVARQDTPPATGNGTLWYNTVEGRLYIKYSDAWVDAAPLMMPQPETELDVNTITFADASVQTTAIPNKLVNGASELVLDEMGFLTVPASIVLSEGVITFMGEADPGIVLGSSINSVFVRTLNGIDQYEWKFGTDGVITLPSGNTRIGNVFGSDAIVGNTGTAVGIVSQGTGGYVGLEWISDFENIGTTSTQVAAVVVNSPFASTSGTVQIATGVSNGPVSSNIWEFGADGKLTLPGAVVNSTVAKNAVSGPPLYLGDSTWGTALVDGTYGPFTLSDVVFTVQVSSGIVGYNITNVLNNATFTREQTIGTLDSGDLGGTPGTTSNIAVTALVPLALDLTKTVNKLTDGNYALADGVEGQIMYLVRQTGSTYNAITVNVANGRVDGTLYTTIDYYPFENISAVNMSTLIFTDGAWQADNGGWD